MNNEATTFALWAEVERLKLWIRRIDNINDDPACFNREIDQACRDALAGRPMTGRIDYPVDPSAKSKK